MTYIFYLIKRGSKSSNCRLFKVHCPAVTFPPETATLLVATRQSESKNGSDLLPVGFILVLFSEKVCFFFIMLPCMPEESLSYIVDFIWDRNWEMSNPNQNVLFHSLAIDIQKTELLPEPKVFHCHCHWIPFDYGTLFSALASRWERNGLHLFLNWKPTTTSYRERFGFACLFVLCFVVVFVGFVWGFFYVSNWSSVNRDCFIHWFVK